MKKPPIIWPLTLLSAAIIGISLFARESQWQLILVGVGIILALGVLDHFTPQIAQLNPSNAKVKTMRRLNRLFILFFTLVFSFLVWYPDADSVIAENENGMAFIITLAVMAIIGNTAPKLPFNRYMGMRLPWTVRDEETWKVAHKWLGYVTFPIILLMILAYLFDIAEVEIVKYGILSWIAVPGIYSAWVYYKRLG